MSIEAKLAEYRALKAREVSKISPTSSSPLHASTTTATRDEHQSAFVSTCFKILSIISFPVSVCVGLIVSLATSVTSLLQPLTTRASNTRLARQINHITASISEYLYNSRAAVYLTNTLTTPLVFGITVSVWLGIVLWFVLWLVFIKLQFGAVYFIVTLMWFMYMNTGRGERERGAPSAYSVFNRDCERIQGTFTAEQFENQLRYGGARVS